MSKIYMYMYLPYVSLHATCTTLLLYIIYQYSEGILYDQILFDCDSDRLYLE